MSDIRFPPSFEGVPVHLVGIKGTGMSALAEILKKLGAVITGSDTHEQFYTDEILRSLGISFTEGFDSGNVPAAARLVVHSAAYDPNHHPELLRAVELGIPIIGYHRALGELSTRMPSNGISGVHGKTTTTAMTGVMVRELGLPGVVLAGSAVAGFDGRSTLFQGTGFFVAETCEYRRHFLSFAPRNVVLTSIEPDHLDYFHDLADIEDAFEEYALKLPDGGALIYCADDEGAATVARRVLNERPDIEAVPYGLNADGPYRISGLTESAGTVSFSVAAVGSPVELHVPGRHNVLNAAAAIALVQKLPGYPPAADGRQSAEELIVRALASFRGSRRRSEIVGEAGGILVIDDYAHHPTAISKTLEGIASFYPGRRIVVDFMSHTYSRTEALLSQFGSCFGSADVVIVHKIYASARERVGRVTGEDLASEVARNRSRVHYVPEVLDALPTVMGELRSGDIFVTMGAGDNWKLGRAVLSSLAGERLTAGGNR
ncbi:UDP-N-acetylmuramate--L-alanine ligase [Salinispira pacifica]